MGLNTIIEDDTLEDLCSGRHKRVGSQTWKEFDWKVKMKFFRTPLVTFVFKNYLTNKCWGSYLYFLGLPQNTDILERYIARNGENLKT